MTAKALFEQQEGKGILKLKDYCEDSSIWKGLTRNALAGILLYLILFAMAVLAAPDWFIALRTTLGDVLISGAIAISLAIFAVLYSLISDVIFRRQYRNIKSRLSSYKACLKRLEKINREPDSFVRTEIEQEQHETDF